MSILNGYEPTKDEKIHDTRMLITKISNKLYQRINREHTEIFNYIWNNSDGLTAQEIFDEYGTNAVDLFTFSSNIQQMLSDANENYIALETPYTYTINPDGTVTVNYS